MQFLDRRYDAVPADGGMPVNAGDEESACARFLFNLWDGINVRVPRSDPPFAGDNDDLYVGDPLGHPRPWLLYALEHLDQFQVRISWPSHVRFRRMPYLDVYRENFLKLADLWYPYTGWYRHQPIDAQYRASTARDVNLRSATPTVLTVTGDHHHRLLNWNDHTEPETISYPCEASGIGSFFLSNNNESGFVIWRKQVTSITRHRPVEGVSHDPEIVDGRLDGRFLRVALVPHDVTSYTDNEPLGEGTYIYVVVAYAAVNSSNVPSQLSIPMAEAVIHLDGPGTCVARTPSTVIPSIPSSSRRTATPSLRRSAHHVRPCS